MNRKEAYEYGIHRLREAGFPEAKSDILLLLDGLMGLRLTDLLAHGETELSEEEQIQYENALQKRLQHIPVQQITGVQNFMGLPFLVNGDVLIPRPETELLVEEVLKNLHDGFSVLDICTGSGCIALSIKQYSNNCPVTASDVSEEALAVARKNGETLGHPVNWVQSNLFENISGRFDIIVSNPPYIKTEVISSLMDEVRKYEPVIALDGKEDGLYFYREIVKDSVTHLNRGGMLFFEIGYDQGEAVSSLMKKAGFKDIQLLQDYAGLDRVISAVYY